MKFWPVAEATRCGWPDPDRPHRWMSFLFLSRNWPPVTFCSTTSTGVDSSRCCRCCISCEKLRRAQGGGNPPLKGGPVAVDPQYHFPSIGFFSLRKLSIKEKTLAVPRAF